MHSFTHIVYSSLYNLMEIWSQVMETGATPPVDIYPFLHWLPQRIFLHWRDRATHVQRSMNSLYSSFLSGLRSRRAATGSRGSLMDKVLDQVEREKAAAPGMTYSDHELWFLGGTLTEGGSDTSASIITAFVQAMLANPAVQRKAQAEIDAVIPKNRSPTWADYASLPTGVPACSVAGRLGRRLFPAQRNDSHHQRMGNAARRRAIFKPRSLRPRTLRWLHQAST
jgi:hypothetical protein